MISPKIGMAYLHEVTLEPEGPSDRWDHSDQSKSSLQSQESTPLVPSEPYLTLQGTILENNKKSI